jgi:hypothetical protein
LSRKVVTWHGESRTLFYVVEGDDTDWEVVETFHSRQDAEEAAYHA